MKSKENLIASLKKFMDYLKRMDICMLKNEEFVQLDGRIMFYNEFGLPAGMSYIQFSLKEDSTGVVYDCYIYRRNNQYQPIHLRRNVHVHVIGQLFTGHVGARQILTNEFDVMPVIFKRKEES